MHGLKNKNKNIFEKYFLFYLANYNSFFRYQKKMQYKNTIK